MESWDRIYSIGVRSDARTNCLNLLPHGVLTTHRGVGASLGSCSQTVISLWHSRLFGDNRPQTALYPRCREGGGLMRG